MINSDTIPKNFELSLYMTAETSYEQLNITDVSRAHWIISHVLEGEVTMLSGGESYPVTSGDVMIHPPGVRFSEHSGRKGCHQVLLLHLYMSPRIDLLRYYPVFPVVRLSDPGHYAGLFRTLLQVWSRPDSPVRELQLMSFTLLLVGQLLESWLSQGAKPRPSALATKEDRFIMLINEMNRNLDQKISRDHLAKLAHLHPNYLDKAFFQCYGMTPMQMLKHLRLSRSRHLLENTEETLETIAAACGFGDASYFSNVFRTQFGLSPGKYRESVNLTRTSYLSLW